MNDYEFKVGDRVIATVDSPSCPFRKGAVGTYANPPGPYALYPWIIWDGLGKCCSAGCAVPFSEFKLLQEEPAPFKPGDIVHGTVCPSKRKVVARFFPGACPRHEEAPAHVHYTTGSWDRVSSLTLVSHHTYAPGDRVRIIKSDSCGIPIGTIATLTDHISPNWLMDCPTETGHTQGEHDFEPVVEEEEEETAFGAEKAPVAGVAGVDWGCNPQPTSPIFFTRNDYVRYDLDWDAFAQTTTTTKPKKGNTIMSTIKEKIRKLRLSTDDRALEEQGFMDSEGDITQEYKEAVWEMLYDEYKPKVLAIAKELVEAEKAEAKSKK